jgi:hypothetical protein
VVSVIPNFLKMLAYRSQRKAVPFLGTLTEGAVFLVFREFKILNFVTARDISVGAGTGDGLGDWRFYSCRGWDLSLRHAVQTGSEASYN